ncbi:MAG: hypothetical protein J5732_08335 [Bacteroidaceae bacterium]|nr:hypothetical protein [Bacteroidaceae bacterium]
MKKSFMTLAAVFCCTILASMFTACNKDDSNPSTDDPYYSYSVKLSRADFNLFDENESEMLQNAFNAAIGEEGRQYWQENRDNQMKTACDAVRDRYINSVQSVYMEFSLIRSTYRKGTGAAHDDTIGTYEFGKALTHPYVRYAFRTNILEASEALAAKKETLEEDVFKASSKNLKRLLGVQVTDPDGTVRPSMKSYFDNSLVGRVYEVVLYTQEDEASMKHICDSVADAHANDTLAVDAKIVLTKTGYLNHQTEEIWSRLFNANF